MLVQVGQAMAKLHALEAPLGLPGQFPYGLKNFDEIVGVGTYLKETKGADSTLFI